MSFRSPSVNYSSEAVPCITFDVENVDLEWVHTVTGKLVWASSHLPGLLASVLPIDSACAIIEALESKLKTEKTLLEITPKEGQSVTVVGDLHGQLHDFLHMFKVTGGPSAEKIYVFNGDFVDRGAWGMELLTLLACWKLVLPDSVYLLRGDHESISTTCFYGFKAELQEKYGPAFKTVYRCCKSMFAHLPLGALIKGNTLVIHGGLWRSPYDVHVDDNAQMTRLISPGDLDDLRTATKGGKDPSAYGKSLIASDVLWSDPTSARGMRVNKDRGMGIYFGPDVTEEFMRDNGISLIIRSHESPDGREDRRERGLKLSPLNDGRSICHRTRFGNLMTVFSAPDYPMFTENQNKAAVLRLYAPNYDDPRPLVYEGQQRPTSRTHPYMFENEEDTHDSDDELYQQYEEHMARMSAQSMGTNYSRYTPVANTSPPNISKVSRMSVASHTSDHDLVLSKAARKPRRSWIMQLCCPE